MTSHPSVWITGLGIISSRGEGSGPHAFPELCRAPPSLDVTTYAPFPVHPMVPLALDTHIPKKLDQRQMEPWQRFGVYGAGMALQDAGLSSEHRAATDLLVAAGGGERDCGVDEIILSELMKGVPHEKALNERLMQDLRPTLFLAQLSNLLAGNIALVHGVTGPSRTLLGEEQAGVDVLRTAWAQIRSGQSTCVLAGASYNAERPDVLLIHALNQRLWKEDFRSVWERDRGEGGFILGSGAAFLVLESEEHGRARGVRPHAILSDIRTAFGSVDDSFKELWAPMVSEVKGEPHFIISGATGLCDSTRREASFLARQASGCPVYTTGDALGHLMEAHFLASVISGVSTLKAVSAHQAFITSTNHGPNRKGEYAVGLAALGGAN